MIVPFFMGAENDSGKIQGENTGKKEGMTEMVEALPATSRHTRRLLRLLPSGPDRVNKLVLRENQQGPHCHYWLRVPMQENRSGLHYQGWARQKQGNRRRPLFSYTTPRFLRHVRSFMKSGFTA